MGQHVDGGKRTFIAAADIEAYTILEIVSGGKVKPYAAGNIIGVSETKCKEGENLSVILKTFPGTVEIKASGAIVNGTKVSAAAGGTVKTLDSGEDVFGFAFDDAVDGSVVEVMIDVTPA